jgi:hypothetical protein
VRVLRDRELLEYLRQWFAVDPAPEPQASEDD